MDTQQRISDMGRGPFFLAVVTALLSGAGVAMGIGPALDGDVFGYTRIALGLLGLVAAALLLFGKDRGKTGIVILMVWAAIQCLYYANHVDGNFTRQGYDVLLGVVSQKSVNGEITSYSAMGINAVGLAMLIWAGVSRSRIELWQRRAQ